ncbi:MAG: hypothetical protein JO254_09140 [Pseudolabrys sp.]|nr:hypothetical protein [Pseudolabrys sp.]
MKSDKRRIFRRAEHMQWRAEPVVQEHKRAHRQQGASGHRTYFSIPEQQRTKHDARQEEQSNTGCFSKSPHAKRGVKRADDAKKNPASQSISAGHRRYREKERRRQKRDKRDRRAVTGYRVDIKRIERLI